MQIGDLPPPLSDRALLRQVLSNLMGNAVKFTRDSEHAVIEISGSNSVKYNTYCIKDNGAGFDMRYMTRSSRFSAVCTARRNSRVQVWAWQ